MKVSSSKSKRITKNIKNAKNSKKKVVKKITKPPKDTTSSNDNALPVGQFELTVGQKVEVLDYCNIWRLGEIRSVDTWDKTVSVHYDGCDSPLSDEWFDVSSGRFRLTKKDSAPAVKIPKADLAIMASSMPSAENKNSETVQKQTGSNYPKLATKERRVPQFRKGTYVITTWVDGKSYPAVVVRILSELSFLVEFNDGSRWSLGAHCFIRTLSRTEYERLIENPECANEILCPKSSRPILSPIQSPKESAAPPRKRLRYESPAPLPPPPPPPQLESIVKTSRRSTATSRRSSMALEPEKAPEQEKTTDLGGSSKANFKSKASVRSVSPLPQASMAEVEVDADRKLSTRNRRSTISAELPTSPIIESSASKKKSASSRKSTRKPVKEEEERGPSPLEKMLAMIPSKNAPGQSLLQRKSRSLGGQADESLNVNSSQVDSPRENNINTSPSVKPNSEEDEILTQRAATS